MIEKLEPLQGLDHSWLNKINELVDAVNELQESQNTYWTDIAELKKELLTHTKIAQGFKNLQDHRPNMVMDDPFGPHPNIYEQGRPAENVQEPIKLYVCADGCVYDNLDVAKSHAASIFNPLPAGATTTDRVYLEQELIRTRKELEQSEICCTEWEKQALDYKAENIALSGELERTRKALELAITGLKNCKTREHIGAVCRTPEYVDKILEQITALEQKEKR